MLDNIGFLELLVIVVIALFVMGPERIPDLARNIAKLSRWKSVLEQEVRTTFEPLVRPETLLDPPPKPSAPTDGSRSPTMAPPETRVPGYTSAPSLVALSSSPLDETAGADGPSGENTPPTPS